MKTWKLWLGLIAIFLAGICIGATGTALVIRHTVLSALSEGPPAITRFLVTRLTNKLHLSPQQAAAINTTMVQTQQRLLELRSRYQPEARGIVDDGLAQMRRELTPEQQQQLEQLHQKAQRRFHAFKSF